MGKESFLKSKETRRHTAVLLKLLLSPKSPLPLEQKKAHLLEAAETFLEKLQEHEIVEKTKQGGWSVTKIGHAWLRRFSASSGNRSLAFLAQHQEHRSALIEGESGQSHSVLRNISESPLSWFAHRKDKEGRPLLHAEQIEAGETLRRDYFRGQFLPRLSRGWPWATMRVDGNSGVRYSPGELSLEAQAARMRVKRALEGVGPELCSILEDVCFHLKGLGQVEREHAWPTRAGRVVLGLALTRLARHYAAGYVKKNQTSIKP